MASFTGAPQTEEPASQTHESEDNDLTPLRAHYLKKSLIQLQFGRELDLITSSDVPNVSNLSFLGPPFSLPPKGVQPLDLPFLKFAFRQFVLTFPFMEAAPKGFYSDKVQPFVDAMVARNLSSSSLLDDPQSEAVSRKKILTKIERNLSMFIGSATKLVETEDIVRLTQSDLDRLEKLAEKRKKRLAKNKDAFEVNVVGVRTVVEKGRVRSRSHEEFIIRTRRSRYHDVYVSRRYGDFKTLANELAKRYPEENVRLPPPKDRSTVSVPSSAPPTTTNFAADAASPASASSKQSWDGPETQIPSPISGPRKDSASRLSREKNRLTLRFYLKSLLSSRALGSSPVLKAFLLMNPITMSPEELEDARRREEADRVREEGRKRFAKEIAARVDGLRDAVKSVKGDIMGEDGLTRIFSTIKVTPDIRDLPENYRAVVEWGRISLASAAFHTFVASDDASETFAGLKRIHGLMPYFMLKTALKITNPIAMIRTVLDLFLAQPFGGRSLLQRMFTTSLTEEVRALEEDIEAVKDKVDDPMMCDKIRHFVYAPREIQEMFRMDAESEKMNIITVVLRSSEAPVLARTQMLRLARSHRAHAAYTKVKEALEDSDDDDGPQDEDAWLIEDLKVLTGLYQRLRDREQLIALVFEGFTSELLKDIITIFYSPLAKVYRAASIADSVGDLQNFISDLIRTVEQVEEVSQEDPVRTVQEFVNLIQRHEQSFYSFVHKVHSKGEGLFDSLMRWIELFLTVIREGLGPPISLEFLLPHTGKERSEILAEVDKVALHHYKLKVLYEDKLRRRFGRAQAGKDADAEDEAAREMVNGVLGEINFGDIVQGDAVDLAAAETDEEDETSSSYDSSSYDSDATTSSGSGSGSDSDNEDSGSPQEPVATPSLANGRGPRPPAKDGVRKHVLPPQATQHRHSSSSRTSIASADVSSASSAGSKGMTRKRSMSLRSVRSITFSRNGISLVRKDSQGQGTPPPVPSIPPSLRSGSTPSSSRESSRPRTPDNIASQSTPKPAGRPPPARSSSTKTVRQKSSSSSVYASAPSAAASTSSLQQASETAPAQTISLSQLAESTTINALDRQPSLRDTFGRSETMDSVISSTSISSRPPMPTRTLPTEPISPPVQAALGTSQVPQKPKKKKAQQNSSIQPPELTEIPKLLPVFVEMMRPMLRPRKRTTAAPSTT